MSFVKLWGRNTNTNVVVNKIMFFICISVQAQAERIVLYTIHDLIQGICTPKWSLFSIAGYILSSPLPAPIQKRVIYPPSAGEFLKFLRVASVIRKLGRRSIHYSVELLKDCRPLAIREGAKSELQLGGGGRKRERKVNLIGNQITSALYIHHCASN